MVAVETARLVLRVPQTSDAEPFLEIILDPEVLKGTMPATLTTSPGGIGLAQRSVDTSVGGIDRARRNVERMRRHWDVRGYGQWTVLEKATDQVIGIVGLQSAENWPGIEMAWGIRHSRWGNGFATEAIRAALQWAWENTDLDDIISLIAPDNLPALRVAAKIGERFERFAVNPIDGTTVHVYSIRRSDRQQSSQ